RRETCVCEQGRVSLNGACLAQAEANAYCGKGAVYSNYGCVRIPCGPGQELDQATGTCLDKKQVDKVAEQMGVPVGANQKLGCPPGLVLVIENPQTASCVPPQNTCSRDEIWNGRACAKLARCSPGWVYDATTNTCVAVSTEEEKYTVDLPAWTFTSYGPAGGAGTAAFCSGFNKKPRTFGVMPGSSITVVVHVTVTAPGKNAQQASAATTALVQGSNAPVTQKGAAEIQQAAQEVLAALRAMNGKTNTDAARTNVRCTIINAAAPASVPATVPAYGGG
ncbi:MAG: hypothetical protein MUF54_24965, partial [Polyangiaceae bacterium]|nr:hypothetical protein [Polyangiaceae bacterium]